MVGSSICPSSPFGVRSSSFCGRSLMVRNPMMYGQRTCTLSSFPCRGKQKCNFPCGSLDKRNDSFMKGWTTHEGPQLRSQSIKASALLDREAQPQSLKKVFHLLNSMNPCEGAPYQHSEHPPSRLRAEPALSLPLSLSRPLLNVTDINPTTVCRVSDAYLLN